MKTLIKEARRLAKPFRVTDDKFRLKGIDPAIRLVCRRKQPRKQALAMGIEVLAEPQGHALCPRQLGVLLVFQAMDAAGKDGAIKHVMSGVNPQGRQVFSFKAPTSEDLDHDYLWRCMKWLPERGRIGIFNRSYYEETLVVRVHEVFLHRQKLPPELINKDIWDKRFQDIRGFERISHGMAWPFVSFSCMSRSRSRKSGFSNASKNPKKTGSSQPADAKERHYRKAYMDAYEDTIRNTATKAAPWYVVPADNKWFTRIVVAAAVIGVLDDLDLDYLKVSDSKLKELAVAKKELLAGK